MATYFDALWKALSRQGYSQLTLRIYYVRVGIEARHYFQICKCHCDVSSGRRKFKMSFTYKLFFRFQ